MANVVVFQLFSSSKLQYSEHRSCEALREKEELHVTQRILWTVFNQSKCSSLINKFLITLRKQWDWTQNFFLHPTSVSD